MPGQWFLDVGDLLRTAATTAPEDCPDAEAVSVDPVLYEAVITGYLGRMPTGAPHLRRARPRSTSPVHS